MDTTAPGPGTKAGELPSGTDVAVRIRGLRKVYGGVAAVDGLDLDIARGETFALLGPNGAGKSTTVEILEGYRLRTDGEVQVLGVDPARGDLDWKARLGIVLQSATESGVHTVREQLTHYAGFYPDPRDVDEVIAAVGLEAKARTRVSRLSGGQRRRVDELGGPEARIPIVRWREPDGTPREVRTERPAELVASVVAEHGGEPDALEVIRPSLEDIYLRLVHAAGADAHDDEEALA